MPLSRNWKHFYLGKLFVILFKFLQRVTNSISLFLLTLLFHWNFLSSSHVFYIIFLWFHIYIVLKLLTLHNLCMCFSIWYYFNSCIIFLLCIFESFKDVKRLDMRYIHIVYNKSYKVSYCMYNVLVTVVILFRPLYQMITDAWRFYHWLITTHTYKNNNETLPS
jgi:hypothetical protein